MVVGKHSFHSYFLMEAEQSDGGVNEWVYVCLSATLYIHFAVEMTARYQSVSDDCEQLTLQPAKSSQKRASEFIPKNLKSCTLQPVLSTNSAKNGQVQVPAAMLRPRTRSKGPPPPIPSKKGSIRHSSATGMCICSNTSIARLQESSLHGHSYTYLYVHVAIGIHRTQCIWMHYNR